MHLSQNDPRKRRNAICEDSHVRIMGLAALSAQVNQDSDEEDFDDSWNGVPEMVWDKFGKA